MDYEYWTKTINEEDRKINNANRRFRYHCYSLESMSEELIYQERSLFPHNDFTTELFNEDFIDTVQNEKLAKALRRLTDRQKQAIDNNVRMDIAGSIVTIGMCHDKSLISWKNFLCKF